MDFTDEVPGKRFLTNKREVPHSNGSPLSAGMKAYRTSGFDAHLFCSDLCRSAKP